MKRQLNLDVNGFFCETCMDDGQLAKNDKYLKAQFNNKMKKTGRNTCQSWAPIYYITDSEDEDGNNANQAKEKPQPSTSLWQPYK